MSRDYKLKDYTKKNYPSGGRRRGPWWIVILILVLTALVFVGISAYKPVYNYVTGRTAPNLPPPPVVEFQPEITPEPVKPVEEALVESSLSPEVKGAVLSYEVASDSVALKKFIESLPKEINMLYLEVKSPQGQILFKTENQQAKEWGGLVENPLDIPALVAILKESGLSLGVKLSVFSDPIAARGNLQSAIMHSSGVLWIDNTLDNGGKPWLSPYGEAGVAYNLSLISELSGQGVGLIVLEHVQLPNDPTNSAVLGATKDVPLLEKLDQFIQQAQKSGGEVPVYLLLSENQVVEGPVGANLQNFGGDPTKLPALGWVIVVEGTVEEGDKDILKALAPLENSILLSYQKSAKVPVEPKSFIISLS